VKQESSEPGSLEALEKLLRNDLIGIDVATEQGGDAPAVRSKWLHQR
jgi:hypothetical protein